ncbi:hypothetical protein BS50DRAFT_207982 [Corynespora cassiicola Philippines]|uniref:Uncharacterized protein n=1 Tax=Corynespora cassiicola Philippines TaxID=1448308 RepID=A0A2T2N528_CORCC|nr:hypothetical protein BS50DRAFT_207982 [Corynespora cassiicola Philippines]
MHRQRDGMHALGGWRLVCYFVLFLPSLLLLLLFFGHAVRWTDGRIVLHLHWRDRGGCITWTDVRADWRHWHAFLRSEKPYLDTEVGPFPSFTILFLVNPLSPSLSFLVTKLEARFRIQIQILSLHLLAMIGTVRAGVFMHLVIYSFVG